MVAMSARSEIKCKDATEGCGSDELQERVRRVRMDLEEAETRYDRSILYEISKKLIQILILKEESQTMHQLGHQHSTKTLAWS